MSTSDTHVNEPLPHDEASRVNERPFRFKGSTYSTDAEREREREHGRERDRDPERHRRRRRHHHQGHGSRKRRKLSNDFTSSTSSLPPDIAFRESLFDALGDDEGADFWQGVYGQPIHTYSRMYEDADTGELGEMDDEQYAAYVRRRMWEKSAEGLQAAREARRKEEKENDQRRRTARAKSDPKAQEPATPEFLFDLEFDASLKRGQHRKEKKRWQGKWQIYLDTWKDLNQIYVSRAREPADDAEQIFLQNRIAWPVESGKSQDISPEGIAQFFDNVSAAEAGEEDIPQVRMSILKAERIRWHPDKIQQRYGFMQIDQGTKEAVTAVFQIIDDLWSNSRSHK